MKKHFALLGLMGMVVLGLWAGPSLAGQEGEVVVYYFHTTFRCRACNVIERNTEDALKGAFAQELASGQLKYKPVNIDERGNRHFIDDYRLYTKAVVLSMLRDGKETRFKNLDKVWQLLRNRDQFLAYVQQETGQFLKELEGGS